MDIAKINAALLGAISNMTFAENQHMAEMVGEGGTEPTTNMIPSGDPKTGGAGGVANTASDVEAFDSYLEQAAFAISSRCDISVDDAIGALIVVADEQAAAGAMPAMPDPDSATAEELSAWAGAAKQIGLVGLAIQYWNDDDQNIA